MSKKFIVQVILVLLMLTLLIPMVASASGPVEIIESKTTLTDSISGRLSDFSLVQVECVTNLLGGWIPFMDCSIIIA